MREAPPLTTFRYTLHLTRCEENKCQKKLGKLDYFSGKKIGPLIAACQQLPVDRRRPYNYISHVVDVAIGWMTVAAAGLRAYQ